MPKKALRKKKIASKITKKKGWMDNNSLVSYNESINSFARKPSVIIPFIISSLFPIIIIASLISVIAGPEGFNYYYNNNFVITSQETQINIFIALAIAGVFSAVISGFFDASGVGMCLLLAQGKNPSLNDAWSLGKKNWVNMILTFLVLTLVAITLTYPALMILSFDVNLINYLWYAIPALVFYGTILVYPRIITVSDNKGGFDSVIEGIKLMYSNLKFNVLNFMIIGVIIASFSLIYVFSPSIHFLLNTCIATPWVNLFIAHAYVKIKK